MLSRRLLRVKAMQVAYSAAAQGGMSEGEALKLLDHSVGKSQDLYCLLLQLPYELRRLAAKRIEIGLGKIRPTEADLHPNRRFADNRFIAALYDEGDLLERLRKAAGSWADDETMLKTLFNKMTHCDVYRRYMEADEDGMAADKAYVLHFFGKELPKHAFFFAALELKSLFWNDEAEFMISIAIKSFKDFDPTAAKPFVLAPVYKDDDDRQFALTLLKQAIDLRDETIQMIGKYSKNWETDRVAAMDIVLMTLAVAEMTAFKHISIKVTLNEYIEIAKHYSTDKSGGYINGLLEKIVRELLDSGRIVEAQLL